MHSGFSNRRPLYNSSSLFPRPLLLKAMTNFYHSEGWGNRFAWGAKRYVGQPELEAFKYRALKDWLAVNRGRPDSQEPVVNTTITMESAALGGSPNTNDYVENGYSLSEKAPVPGPPITLLFTVRVVATPARYVSLRAGDGLLR